MSDWSSDVCSSDLLDAWAGELRELRAVAYAPKVAPRPMLVVHGSDDDLVPVFDARVLVDAHGDAELRLISGAGHRLRHDPRAVAVLLGWPDSSRLRTRSEEGRVGEGCFSTC